LRHPWLRISLFICNIIYWGNMNDAQIVANDNCS